MDRAVEAPGRRIAQRARLHRLDAQRIPEDRIGPLPAQFPKILSCLDHDGCLPLCELQRRKSSNASNFYLKLKSCPRRAAIQYHRDHKAWRQAISMSGFTFRAIG